VRAGVLGDADACKAVSNALGAYTTDTDVQRESCRALGSLSRHLPANRARLLALPAPTHACNLVRIQANKKELAVAGLEAICSLLPTAAGATGAEAAADAERLVAAGVSPAITSVLRDATADPQTAALAARVALSLCPLSPALLQSLADLRIDAAIQRAAQQGALAGLPTDQVRRLDTD
jgi:hypothetical protein